MNRQKKKLDSRVPTLIANGVQTGHRSFFVIVGDHGKDQVVTLHYLLAKARVAERPSVLWCYKKDLGFTSHRKKRISHLKKQIAKGVREADQDDPFELFVSSTQIRYTYYKETDKILGNTYGMCVLQDFEALTPNLLARTIETVEGGGVVVLLLKSMRSLKQLYTMTMDVHSRYRTEAHQDTIARFNERFILSLGSCNACLVVDDELNVLPLSQGKDVKPLPRSEGLTVTSDADAELKSLKQSLKDVQPVGGLVECCKTLDQARAVLTFTDAIAEKTLRSTVALTAARGRGKSAALGVAVAAVAYGYSNIFITSPSPENLKTLFEFVFKGLTALGFEEHLDYDVMQTTNPVFNKAIVRVNVFKDHRQTIQWIQPTDNAMLAQAELLVIDEAAAIPLTVVKKLLGPYLIFMASTINGYEGTGRSLSLKLIQQLREQSAASKAASKAAAAVDATNETSKQPTGGIAGRTLSEITLIEPIRYSVDDPVEKWLNKLLCLDCCTPKSNSSRLPAGCPHPSKCELFFVNRDTLFSYHPVSEAFLQKLMSLYVASHYKNSPNDLQLLSDAPAHNLFVLLPPIDESNANSLPEPLCVVQLCLEGSIARASAMASLARGVRSSGDLIPWVVSQQFQDDDFASLSGGRVVRIATHPDYIGMGYGARALEQLKAYYCGEIQSVRETNDRPVVESVSRISDAELSEMTLNKDTIAVREASSMPPLLLKLSERQTREQLHWLGVSYGITENLHKFWKRAGYIPVYLRQTANDLTGEHTCIMLKQLDSDAYEVKVGRKNWLADFTLDFRRRLIELLSYQFRSFSPILALSVIHAASHANTDHEASSSSLNHIPIINSSEVNRRFTPFDLKRLGSYSQNLLDYHVIMDLVPQLAQIYFLGLLSGTKEDEPVKLSPVQSSILLGTGLQKKSVEDLEKELNLPVSQILALFAKSVRKISNYLNTVVERNMRKEVEETLDVSRTEQVGRDMMDTDEWDPVMKPLDEDLAEAGDEAMEAFRAKQKEIIGSLNLSSYEIDGDLKDWENVKPNGGSNIVSIRNENSSKKLKVDKNGGLAAELNEKALGSKSGVFDPKNLVSKLKAKKAKQKANRDKKKQV